MKDQAKFFLIIAACIAFSCAAEDRPLNVVIIGVDTLRPDHLGCYGYDRSTSPNTDKLASEGVLFENVVSQAPWTHPSFATAFTSLYPTQHGATTVDTRMRSSFPTLASLLKEQGYFTGAIINAPSLSPEFGVNRGFDFYDFLSPWKERRADEVTVAALEWVDTCGDQPFFLFVHYFDPHLPYAPPPPFDKAFDPEYTGTMGTAFDIRSLPAYRLRFLKLMESLPAADRNHIKSLYDGEIAFADVAVGDLLEGLKDRGLRRHTLIVFMSDHGEELIDHGALDHGHTLYNELIRVPLIFALPENLPEGRRVAEHVRLVDLTPTVIDLVGYEQIDHFEGVSLKPLLTGAGTLPVDGSRLLAPGVCYAEALRHRTTLKSITAYPWKLIYDTQTKDRMVFNLRDDRCEQLDLASTEVSSGAAALEETLFRTLIDISDTWFVGLSGGGSDHVFDLDITSGEPGKPNAFRLHRWISAGGRVHAITDSGIVELSHSRLTVKDIRAQEQLTLAFRVPRMDAPIRFDFRIDGIPAAGRTFIGRSLTRPPEMPFAMRDSIAEQAVTGRPSTMPDPPYLTVWRTTSRYEGETTIELDEETKQNLRSLGYIQ
jgi:arylsulfatase A-like enzyme